MFIFKTSGKTFDSVIRHQKHAFKTKPRDWEPGEIVLVSKNKKDCKPGEKQISYTMRLQNIRETTDGEIEIYWPDNPGRWNYIVDCTDKERLPIPFNLEDIIGDASQEYKPILTFKKVKPDHEKAILAWLGAIVY